MLSILLSAIGVAIALIAAFSYVKLIIDGQIKPHRITWGGWSLAGILGLWASFDGGAKIGLIVPAVMALLVVVTFLFSLVPKYGKPGGRKTDYIFGGAAALGLVTWRIFSFSDDVAATIAVISDAVFLWFTLKEAWLHPEEENPLPWTMGTVAEFLGVLALGKYSYAAAAFPIYILLGNLAVAWALVISGPSRAASQKI